MRQVIEAKTSPVLLHIAKMIWPELLKLRHVDLSVEVLDDGLLRLKALHDSHAILCPNHSSALDSDVMFHLSRLTGDIYNFMAAREIFQGHHGLNQAWLQRLGCFSVVRGTADPGSFRESKSLLMQPGSKLVIFPEGEITHHNDKLNPLEPGAAHIGLSARQMLNREQPLEDIALVPIAIAYRLPKLYEYELKEAIDRVAARLYISASIYGGHTVRLKRCFTQYLHILEEELKIKSDDTSTIDERLKRIRSKVLSRTAKVLNVDLVQGTQIDWAHQVLNVLFDLKEEAERTGDKGSEPLRKSLYKDLRRVVDLMSVTQADFQPNQPQECVYDLLLLLERDIFGEIQTRLPLKSLVKVGDPILLAPYMKSYNKNRSHVVAEVNNELGSRLRALMEELSTRHPHQVLY